MKSILFFSPVRFDALKQRHQGLAIELAKHNFKVYFVNPISSNGFSCEIIENPEKPFEIPNNLKILNIKVPFKAVSFPIIQNFSIELAYRLLKKKLHIDSEKSFLWIAEPSCASLTKHKWAKIIYDCCDLHGDFPNQKKLLWQNYELEVAEKADLITISHPNIKEHFSNNIKKKALLVSNATFFKTQKIKRKLVDGKIKLLSSGAHYEWVDIEWLKMLANLENVELHIAGRGRGKEFEQLITLKNVFFHGELDQEQLSNLMTKCQIGLIPFKNISLIKGVDPIKAYDYAAYGLKIWAPEIEYLHSNKYITDFIGDLQSASGAINQTFEKDIIERKIPTWKDRIISILPYLE